MQSLDDIRSIELKLSHVRLLTQVPIKEEPSTRNVDMKEHSEAYFKNFRCTGVKIYPCGVRTNVSHYKNIIQSDRILPRSYISYQQKNSNELGQSIEYDLDDEDEYFLEYENKMREKEKRKKLSGDVLEMIIDRLEKETYFKTGHGCDKPDNDDNGDDVCHICEDGDVSNVNQIIYCDMCNVAVHQDCYGVPYIPEGQWLCRRCKLSPMAPIQCELCPLKAGAFKPTAERKFAHVQCAIWLNEVHFGNTAFLEPIEGVEVSLRKRSKLRCLVCKKKEGACLQCSKGSCTRAFHVTCAQQAKLQMTAKAITDPDNPDQIDVKRFVYCHVHGATAVGENEFASNKKRANDEIIRARIRMNSLDGNGPSLSVLPCLDEEAKKRIMKSVGEINIDSIISYWYYKRKNRSGLPLIRRLQMKKASSRIDVATPEVEIQMKGRAAAEKTRLLIDQVQQRERNKLKHLEMSHELLKEMRKMVEDDSCSMNKILKRFIQSLYIIDHGAIFHNPPHGLPHYTEIIKDPIDFSTMKNKATKGEYKGINDMMKDIQLLFMNFAKYNARNKQMLIYGDRVQHEIYNEYRKLRNEVKMLDDTLLNVCQMLYYDEKEETKLNDEEYEEIDIGIHSKKKMKKKKKKNETMIRDEKIEDELNNMHGSMKRKRKVEDMERMNDSDDICDSEPSTSTFTQQSHIHRKSRIEDKKETPRNGNPFLSNLSNSSRRLQLNNKWSRLDINPSSPITRRTSLHQSQSPQSTFNSYRNASCILSPQMTLNSCESSMDTDIDSPHIDDSSFIDQITNDPTILNHGDLVKVDDGNRKLVGKIHATPAARYEDIDEETIRSLNNTHSVLVTTFTNNATKPYDLRYVSILDINKDNNLEGFEEATRHQKMALRSK